MNFTSPSLSARVIRLKSMIPFEKSAIAKFTWTGFQAAYVGDETELTIHQVCADAL